MDGTTYERLTPERAEELGFLVEVSEVDAGSLVEIRVPSEVEGFPYGALHGWLEGRGGEQLLSFVPQSRIEPGTDIRTAIFVGAEDTLACVHFSAQYRELQQFPELPQFDPESGLEFSFSFGSHSPGYAVVFQLDHYLRPLDPLCTVTELRTGVPQ